MKKQLIAFAEVLLLVLVVVGVGAAAYLFAEVGAALLYANQR